MVRFGPLLAGALLLVGVCRADAAGPLRVGAKPNAPPYEYLDDRGEPAGFCVDVLRAVAQQQGLSLQFRALSNQEAWDAFDRREIDLVGAAIHTEERSRNVDFSVPMALLPYSLLVRRGTTDVRAERDLAGHEVLVVQRSPMVAYFAGRGLKPRELPDYGSCLEALLAGEAKAALVPKFTWLHLSQRRGYAGLVSVATEVYPHRVCVGVHKGRADLLARLNEGLFELKNSGELDRIYDRHLGTLERSQLPLLTALRKSAVYLLPVLLGVGFAVHLAWTFALRRLVKRRTADLQAELARRTEAEAELGRTVGQLRDALAEVKQLSGLLPICASCKKIRDDRGAWRQMEDYISANSEATFSHGVCPDCLKTLYPEFRGGG